VSETSQYIGEQNAIDPRDETERTRERESI
jgi:hypothetical protein